MKLARFRKDGGEHLGVVHGNQLFDVSKFSSSSDVMDVLSGEQALLDHIQSAAHMSPPLDLASVELLAPMRRPQKILGIGLNYKAHAAEGGTPTPDFQAWFNKQNSCVNGPYAPIHMPKVSSALDYEGELVVVIGKKARHVPSSEAYDYVAGYMIGNDVSVRDWQRRSPTTMMGKSFDTHGPIGPWFTTKDEIEDPHKLELRTFVNGELRQKASTADMVFSIPDMIEHLTMAFTLEPGDLLFTGTPEGVGFLMKPTQFLKVGDVVRVEIDGLGAIENKVISEPI